jgi:hypothetical protein
MANRETKEETMNGVRAAVATLVVMAIAVVIGVGTTVASGDPPWGVALELRSEELNRQHGLGESARKPTGTSVRTPAWLRALEIRSEALNRKYGLGRYARKPASVTDPQWLRALVIRSDALNRQYKLGEYAPGS